MTRRRRSGRRAGRGRAGVGASAAAALLCAHAALLSDARPAHAQSDLAVDLKQPRTPATVCAELAPAAPAQPPTAAERAQAAELLASADDAALLGEAGEATTLLQEAAALDPSSAEIAYRLARDLEDARQAEAAASEYCRFLSLEPSGAQAQDALERLGSLTETAPASVDGRAEARFEAGVALAVAGDLAGAEDAFSDALEAAPDWPEAWYNRSLVRAGAEDAVGARTDLMRYLALRPGAADAGPVERRIAAASPPAPVSLPSTPHFASNALVPGLGQFRSGRYVAGTAAFAAAAGAVAFGVLSEREVVRCIVVPVGGECPDDQVASTSTERPYLLAGIGGAVLVSLVAALEQQRWYARSVTAIERVGAAVAGDHARLEVGPAVGEGGGGDLSLVRLRF